MPDFNIVKIENNFQGKNFLSFLNPKNWFKKKYTKDNTKILFIDDLEMPVVDNLKKAGYKVTKIRDVKDVDDSNVQASQIIFVDYKGVGKNISQTFEGLGLVESLKEKYSKSKRIILYSAHNFSNNVAMSHKFNIADNRIPKNSDTSEFIKLIESEIRKL